MTHKDLQTYIEDKAMSGLSKISVDFEQDPNVAATLFNVLKTKETYIFSTEEEVDNFIDECRQDLGFAGVDKKYKAGKMSKSGEEIRPEQWIAIVKYQK